MSLSHVPHSVPQAVMNGIPVARAAWGQGSELWTSDGRGVHTTHWCDGECGAEFDNAVYFERTGVSHGHGWACGKCRRVTQTG